MNKRLFISDICDTLFYSNTTYDYIRYVLAKTNNSLRLATFNILNHKLSPLFFLLIIINKITKKDYSKTFALRLIRGYSKGDLYELGETFFDEVLSGRKIIETWEILNKIKSDGEDIYLLSSSIDPIVSSIAKKIPAKFISSELLYADGISTGKLCSDLTGRKQDHLEKIKSFSGQFVTVMTDNFTDKSLMKSADHGIAIVYSESARNAWIDLKPDFIVLKK